MLNDFLPIRKSILMRDHPNGITVVPLSDAHYGSQEFNEVKWHNAIKRIQDDPDCYCILVGDLIDNGLKNSVTNVYEQTATPRQQKEWLYHELQPIRDKVLCAVGGNHERRSIKDADIDPLYDVMARLGIEHLYRQRIAFLAISFDYECAVGKKSRAVFSFAVTHGSGGGQYIGSSANRVERYGQIIEGLDCLITGHTHKPVTFPVSKLVFDTHAKTVKQKQFAVVVASSFLDYGGYAVEKLLTPTATTLTEIQLNCNADSEKYLRVLQ